MVFRKLREHFGIDSKSYMHSIGPEQMLSNLFLGDLSSLSELSSEGKSGSFFYYTADMKYMVKTISKTEHKFLREILGRYYSHMVSNPNSLLCRFMGAHMIRTAKFSKKVTGANKVYFVVMANCFLTDRIMHKRYDLKGSWVNRTTHPDKVDDPGICLKDGDFNNLGTRIHIGPKKREIFLNQLEFDVGFLTEQNIVDYSLLIGVHTLSPTDKKRRFAKKCRKNERDNYSTESLQGSSGGSKDLCHSRQSSGTTFPDVVAHINSSSDEDFDTFGSLDDRPFFQKDEGGMVSQKGNEIYYFGVIDILIAYRMYKKGERIWKSLYQSRKGMSVNPPVAYGKRFLTYIKGKID